MWIYQRHNGTLLEQLNWKQVKSLPTFGAKTVSHRKIQSSDCGLCVSKTVQNPRQEKLWLSQQSRLAIISIKLLAYEREIHVAG